VQELDSDSLDTLATALRDYRVEVLEMNRLEFLAPGVDPFADLEAIPAAHNRRFLFEAKIVEVGPIPARDLQHVAKTRGGDERRFGALPLGNYVDNGGAAVNEKPHLARIDLREPDGVDHTLGEFARGGQRFRCAEVTRRFVKVDEVGEGATDIRGQPPHLGAPSVRDVVCGSRLRLRSRQILQRRRTGCAPGAP
jgi:hypothetical protein